MICAMCIFKYYLQVKVFRKMNISYYLEEHGWSSCWIQVDEKNYEFCISHSFIENPIEKCMQSLIEIKQGKAITNFNWYGEPGGARITIKELKLQKHMVEFIVDSFTNDCGEVVNDFEEIVRFSLPKKLLATMFYYEFKKIAKLLEDKNYSKNRDFPFKIFEIFEKEMVEYVN